MTRYGQVQVDQEGESSPILARKSLHSYTTSLSHVVFGYHPYWKGTAWQNYNYDLLSHIAWFGLAMNSVGDITDSHGWPLQGLVEKAHDNGVKVIVTVTLFDDAGIETLLGNSSYRQNAIDNLISKVIQGNADGVNVDFEFVKNPAYKDEFNTFIYDLTQAFHDQIPGSEVSIAMPSVDWWGSYDYNYLSDNSDGLMIMAYGYYWSGSNNAGPISPLNSGLSSWYIRRTIEDYLSKTGQDGSQLILGLPWYGRSWEVTSTDMGAATIAGSSSSIVYSAAETNAQAYGKQYNSTAPAAWYNNNNGELRQAWYDDSLSLAKKYTYAKDTGIKGIGIWALGYDGGRPELWGGLNEVFGRTTSIQESAPLPGSFSVSNVYPNPFNGSFEIVVMSKESAKLTIQIHDILGAEIFHTYKEVEAGENHLNFQAISDVDLGSGVYFLQVTNEHEIHTQSITYLK